jgi:hypothetical protein
MRPWDGDQSTLASHPFETSFLRASPLDNDLGGKVEGRVG